MLSSIRAVTAATLVSAFAAVGVTAQEPQPATPAPAPAQPPVEVQEMLAEVEQLQAELAAVEAQALEDPSLREEQQQVSTAVQQAMITIDPQIPEQMERIEELQAEAQTAQEAGDVDRIVELATEAQTIQQRFAEVQLRAMDQPDVAAQVQAFRTRLQERMIELDPEAGPRIQRLEELERQLRAASS